MTGVPLATFLAKFQNVRSFVIERDNKQIMDNINNKRECTINEFDYGDACQRGLDPDLTQTLLLGADSVRA